MAYGCKILADSESVMGHRITTMEVTFPRFVLAEFNTHRVFSRNSASSRAIPVRTILDRVKNDPAGPVWWGQNQKGMGAAVELTGNDKIEAQARWLEARDNALRSAETLLNIGGPEQGLHKQITNRLLEPWMWQTVICTATEWSNFFALRCNPFAQPEIRVIADMMREAYESSEPVLLGSGDWHLPLVRDEDRLAAETHVDPDLLLKLSTARCARVSYLTHDGRRDLEADVSLHDSLVSSGHMSPCEHAATPLSALGMIGAGEFSGNFRGWVQYRKTLIHESDFGQAELARDGATNE